MLEVWMQSMGERKGLFLISSCCIERLHSDVLVFSCSSICSSAQARPNKPSMECYFVSWSQQERELSLLNKRTFLAEESSFGGARAGVA